MTPAQAGFCIVGPARRSGSRCGETGGVIEGEQVLGRFTVGERLGGGGYGTVHRAWDERLCRWVAVKSVEGDAVGRVLREAHAAARLNHPGIVTLYELGSHNDTAYLVSELIEGPNLRELAASGALSDREVADFGAELCGALEHAPVVRDRDGRRVQRRAPRRSSLSAVRHTRQAATAAPPAAMPRSDRNSLRSMVLYPPFKRAGIRNNALHTRSCAASGPSGHPSVRGHVPGGWNGRPCPSAGIRGSVPV